MCAAPPRYAVLLGACLGRRAGLGFLVALHCRSVLRGRRAPDRSDRNISLYCVLRTTRAASHSAPRRSFAPARTAAHAPLATRLSPTATRSLDRCGATHPRLGCASGPTAPSGGIGMIITVNRITPAQQASKGPRCDRFPGGRTLKATENQLPERIAPVARPLSHDCHILTF